jgi:hypothetical protein
MKNMFASGKKFELDWWPDESGDADPKNKYYKESVNEHFNCCDHIKEAISASERLKMAQRTRARKAMLAISRKIKLKRPSAMPVLKRRSQMAARKMIYKKVLRGRDKSQLSPSEKDMAELRVKRILKTYKTLPQRLIPKIREIERTRLSRKA